MLPSLAARLSGEMSLTKMWLARRRPYSAYRVNGSHKQDVSTQGLTTPCWPQLNDLLLGGQCYNRPLLFTTTDLQNDWLSGNNTLNKMKGDVLGVFAPDCVSSPSDLIPNFVSLTFIFTGFDKRDLGRTWGQVVWAAVRAWGEAPLSRGTPFPLPLPLPSPTAPATASAHGPSYTAVSTAASAPCLIYLFVIAVLLFVMLWHRFPLPQAAHWDMHLPLPPNCLDEGNNIWDQQNEQSVTPRWLISYNRPQNTIHKGM